MAKRRRQRGEGALFQRSDGMWIGQLDLGYRNGKRNRPTVSSKTQKGALRKLNEKKKQLADHGDVPTADTQLEAWLRYWLENIVARRADPNTIARYRSACESHIIPELGRHRLGKLTPEHVRQLHTRIYGLGLSDSTANATHRALSTALKDAMREGKLMRNVATLVSAPRVGSSKHVALSLEQVQRFLAKAQRDPRTASRWLSAFMIGPRQGETLGLRLDYIDWRERTLDVAWQLSKLPYKHGCGDQLPDKSWPCGKKKPGFCPVAELDIPPGYDCEQLYGRLCLTRPKNAKHRIPIPDPLYNALVVRRQQIEAEREHYVTDHRLVWCRRDGEPIAHEDDYDEWVDWLGAADIPHVKLHAARDTAATVLRTLGYQTDVIKTILGHSSILMTERYTEIDLRLAREALAGYGDALALEA